ncbi:non-ribosomal peptide synthetase [Chitinophaga sp. MD30]|uniref:non-ribosomal peptide synthetase n=1 Tax=Chitinophaga sp. MD30 TaxID=2033437 RepID=UPI000BAF042C|nr:non-ribosomal peptide synthetase [Chitinophaga sp. MD30]ASZ12601.1 hypothetical protein CK934_17375 [Chitinophaga sp. MD30]
MKKQQFSSIYTGAETFLTDHVIRGEKVLPGVTYLELARAAGEYTTNETVTQLRNINWLQPIRVNGTPVQVNISLTDAGAYTAFEVYTGENTAQVHVQGELYTRQQQLPGTLEITAIRNRLFRQVDGPGCYTLFRSLGLEYGTTFQGIQQLYCSEEESLSLVDLPLQAGYQLVPGILDCALQTCIGMHLGKEIAHLMLPFSVREVNIYRPLNGKVWCYAQRDSQGKNASSYDISLLNDNGEVLITFKELMLLSLNGTTHSPDKMVTQVFDAAWEQTPLLHHEPAPQTTNIVLLAGAPVLLADKLRELLECEVKNITEGTREQLFCQVQEEINKHQADRSATHIQLVFQNNLDAEYAFLHGLLQTANQENPCISGKILSVEQLALNEVEGLAALLLKEQASREAMVRYQQGQRMVKKWRLSNTPASTTSLIRDNGIYLITGGAGGLGLILAAHIRQTPGTHIILVGRSKMPANPLPQNTSYRSCDVSDETAVSALIEEILTSFGQLNGIIHSAGVLRDSLLVNKTSAEVTAVFSAKVTGAENLDKATKNIPLDFMLYCSSVAGVFGNAGQADYAAANAWLDSFATNREAERQKGKRHGKTLSINWPLWKEGGMQIGAEAEQYLERSLGLKPMPSGAGLAALDQLLSSDSSQSIVLHGKADRIAGLFSTASSQQRIPVQVTTISDEALHTAGIRYLRAVLAKALRMSEAKLEADMPFERLGIDSIMIVRLNNALEEVFSKIPRTLFFECHTLEELAAYFVEAQAEKLRYLTGLTTAAPAVEVIAAPPAQEHIMTRRQPTPPNNNEPVAIIGISGKYPGADNLAAFWENLKAGKDSITEIPADRWEVEGFYNETKGTPGKSYSKWGGFLDNINHFDPYFFNISPREAALMDPQVRLFLQTVWEAIEDAGYTRSQLHGKTDKQQLGGNVGVYAGVMYEEYPLFGVEERLKGNFINPGGSPATVANRVSYFLNLHGPSMTIDTMCSSSLTAIHLACECLRNGNCNMAIAGGVNISVHPNKYLMLSDGMFASSKGRCESFGEGGEGYVPGEGVGAVLLKPLNKAIADGDHIYGLIRGTAINHGGKTNGFTVPNPKAQAAVIKAAMENAGIQPGDLSYIEAHGTGTSLGDPIEIAGLSKAFGSVERQSCRIGSVKSNIGHCESAAGISGLTKVLLQIKHKQLVPSLHANTLNPNIDFTNSPFRVQQSLEPWNTAGNKPRMAGISGFGAGGSNAHIIVEEYIAAPKQYSTKAPAIILLSAQQRPRLKEMAANLLAHLRDNPATALHDVAYTLQVGREALEERIALLATDTASLLEQLEDYLADKVTDIFTGNASKAETNFLLEGNAGKAFIATATKDKEWHSLMQLWVKGITIDWQLLYTNGHPSRISLPAYPFAKEVCWYPKANNLTSSDTNRTYLHPLLHINSSSLDVQQFSSSFTGEEPFFKDHQVKDVRILPGVAALEMAREAGERSLKKEIVQLKDIAWFAPLTATGSEGTVYVNLYPAEDAAEFEIVSGTGLHCSGILTHTATPAPAAVDLSAIRSTMPESITGTACYAFFETAGLHYGNTFRGIETLYYSKKTALSRITLPAATGYNLSPGMLDSALQTCIGIQLDKAAPQLLLPFSIRSLQLYKALPDTIWCYVKCNDHLQQDSTILSYDIDLLDDNGIVLLQITELILLPQERSNTTSEPAPTGLQILTADWQPAPVAVENNHTAHNATLVLLAGASHDTALKLQEHLSLQVKTVDTIAEQDFFNLVFGMVKTIMPQKKEVRIMILCGTDEYLQYGFITGLLKTITLENPRITTQLVSVESALITHLPTLMTIIGAEQTATDIEVRYVGKQRYIKTWKEIPLTRTPSNRIKEGGTYLITGGAGGLGLIFARHISKTPGTNIILVGRSQHITPSLPPNATYYSCDISDPTATQTMINDICKQYGRLNGIIHSAGVLRDSLIVNKTVKEAEEVLAAKIQGTKNLEMATRNMEIDFMMLCSSLAGVFGNTGQADYAAANAWLDNFASHHNTTGTRRILSISWPLWKEGGMQLDAASERYMEQHMGMSPMPTAEGLAAFEQLLSGTMAQGIVMYKKTTTTQEAAQPAHNNTTTSEEALPLIMDKVSHILAAELSMLPENIGADTPFERYGMDSVMIVRLTNRLEDIFGRLPRTLFFECQTLSELSTYLLANASIQLPEPGTPSATTSSVAVAPVKPPRSRFATARSVTQHPLPPAKDEVAIIGISGRYPGADNLDEFWKNLQAGKDCITEVPANRWDAAALYSTEKGMPGKSYSRWGGFINDVDKFDPLFFNISPREAELMDPQERLFLQTVWETIEDAGYTRQQLGRKVGVYAGVMYEEYQLFGAEETLKGNFVNPAGIASGVANRISYFFNFQGPSMAIDTMCSSSLTAIHVACNDLLAGETEMAIAGGVNVSIHPNKYLMLSHGRFVSGKGRCESFGAGGDGYVPGEGVGAVLLKKLSDAIRDGDHIYGVVKSTAVNHGGRTNGYTVPNPKAQAAVITAAISKAGIRPADISYIEAHGTGTSLGDPIEIGGLNKAFEGARQQACRIGSVKSNIGHCESAAGISGLTKILLQMKYQQLVPSLHSAVLNPDIDFENTPFKVQQRLEHWQTAGDKPRIAGLSSFGAGGSNAHIIIQEYKQEPIPCDNLPDKAIVVLSAKQAGTLKGQVRQLQQFLHDHPDAQLHDIAYTLQQGREPMEERIAFVTDSIEQLQQQLHTFLQGDIKENANIWTGNVKKDTSSEATSRQLPYKEDKPADVAQQWIHGVMVNWQALYTSRTPARISLPTYPFIRERYWIPVKTLAITEQITGKLHPLVHTNESDLEEQRFSSFFTGKEPFFDRAGILEAWALLEMAREAGARSLRQPVTSITDIHWQNSLIVNAAPRQVHISVFSLDIAAGFEIYTVEGEEERTICSGRLSVTPVATSPHQTLAAPRKLLTRPDNTSPDAYVLHPALLSEVMQLIGEENTALLPLTTAAVNIYAPLATAAACAIAKDNNGSHIEILDENGKVLLSIHQLRLAVAAQVPDADNMTYVPVWERIANLPGPVAVTAEQYLLVGKNTRALQQHLSEKGARVSVTEVINTIPAGITTVCLMQGLQPALHIVAEDHRQKELEIFAALQSLLQSAYKELSLRIIVCTQQTQRVLSTDVVSASGAGIHGLVGALVKEQPKWEIYRLDLQHATDWDLITAVPAMKAGVLTACRNGYAYQQQLFPMSTPQQQTTAFRQGGVYVLLGGAGGIGKVTTAYLVQRYQAQVIWLGRRKQDEVINAALDEIATLGVKPVYYSCDATDPIQVIEIYKEIKRHYKVVNGLFHSAIVLHDMLLRNMTTADFSKAFDAKALSAHYLVDAFHEEPLDFICCYSSAQGLTDAPGQANYAAGCTYKDAFARSITGIPTYTINWGYWGEVGVVASQTYRDRMEMVGVGSINAEDGMRALETILSGTPKQVAVIRLSSAAAKGMGIRDNHLFETTSSHSSLQLQHPHPVAYPLAAKEEAAFLELCCKGILQVFLQLGFEDAQPLLQQRKKMQVLDKYEPLFTILIRLLQHEGYISDDLVVPPLQKRLLVGFDLGIAVQQLTTLYPQYQPHGRLLSICLQAFGAVVSGKEQATTVTFPGGSLDYVSGIYKGNAQSDYFNGLLAGIIRETVAAGVSQLQPGQQFRILEVGAGTGGTSQFIFKELLPFREQVEYTYTDLSRSFLLHAERTFSTVAPNLKTAILDIEQPPHQQEVSIGAYDLVIGANVVHATKHMASTVNNLKALLKKDGWLLMNEIARTELFTTLTFGLLDGWWLYEDASLRLPGCPGLSADGWHTVLSETGYQDIQVLPAIPGLGQQIICAKSDGISYRTWTDQPVDTPSVTPPAPAYKKVTVRRDNDLLTKLSATAAALIKLPQRDFDIDGQFMDYGFDSILGTEFVKHVNETFDISLKPTDIYNYANVRQLAAHIGSTYPGLFQPVTEEIVEQETAPVMQVSTPVKRRRRSVENTVSHTIDAIAIIGMSGQFGSAGDLDAYWDVLKEGRNLITDAPEERGGGDGRKGSFLHDVDKFDPLFFKISGKEAEMMDPQQRLFLEHCWKALEDAAINPHTLRGARCGVYAGVAPGDYSVRQSLEPAAMWGNSAAILSSRISYLLDLKGPAISIDTACSSSLVAMDMGCTSLHTGAADLIIAGGVNIMTTADFFGLAGRAGMLSPQHQCFTFDKRADGFVPGEGVGVVVLKRLADAERDGDHIYGVIKASMTNQDGASNGITAPSVSAQTELEKAVYTKFNIDPATITYVEAHGTGTSLGDPIELEALTAAFGAFTDKKQYCGIGSVKTNIGHTLVAAGIAGVLKILLAFRHELLPPTLNYNECNPLIDLENSPFRIQQQLTAWKGTEQAPRRAAISSFGFSGTNAHMILEEYRNPVTPTIEGPAVVVLSAKNSDRLKEQVANLLRHLTAYPDTQLHDLAYTLQVGREQMDERIAIVAIDIPSLVSGLKGIDGTSFSGNVKKDKTDFVLEGGAGQAYINYAIEHKEIRSLAQLWVKGISINWELLYPVGKPRRISLPAYPFARHRYWIPVDEQPLSSTTQQLHPLLHENTSNLQGIQFTSKYTGTEPFLVDHQINDEKILPGTAYLELARAAGQRVTSAKITALRNVSWLQPIRVKDQPAQVKISLRQTGDDISFEVFTDKGVHSQGKMHTQTGLTAPSIRLNDIRNRLPGTMDHQQCYGIFSQMGLRYGTSFRGIEQLFYSDTEALSRINIRPDKYLELSPGLLDSALQTCMGIGYAKKEPAMFLPYSVKEVTLYHPLAGACWAYTRKSALGKGQVNSYDVDIVNDQGEVLVAFREFLTLSPEGGTKTPVSKEEPALHLYANEWQVQPVSEIVESWEAMPVILLGGSSAIMADKMKEELGMEVQLINGDTPEVSLAAVLAIVKEKIRENVKVDFILLFAKHDVTDYGFIAGLLKTAALEHKNISGRTICVDSLQLKDIAIVADVIQSEQFTKDAEVRYEGGVRKVRAFKTLPAVKAAEPFIRKGGVYLITGGAGGLGSIFAAYISQVTDVKIIVLSGRREASDNVMAATAACPSSDYIACDVSNRAEVEQLIRSIKTKYHRLDGIIHSAGVIRDKMLVNKTTQDIQTVLAAKVSGVRNLDEATRDESLDFMVFFSGIAGIMGNVGQADYAAANAFLDNYAHYRELERAKGKRQGKTLSINWPLWKEGGMRVNTDTLRYLEEHIGMLPLPTEEGIRAFESLLNTDCEQGVVMYGRESKFRPMAQFIETTQPVATDSRPPVTVTASTAVMEVEQTVLQQEVSDRIQSITATLLKLQPEDIELDEKLSEYGFDSILLIKYANELNDYYDVDLTPAVFYNHVTINELTAFLLKEHADKLQQIHGDQLPLVTTPEQVVVLPQRYPLTEGQKGLWFIQQLEPDNSNYNVPVAFVIPGSVDTSQLKQALALIMEEHPVLRSRFIKEDETGEVFNHIHPDTTPFFEEKTLTAEQNVEQTCWELVRTPFDLAKDSPVRLYIRKKENRNYILFVFHHIIFDGMSSSVFLSLFLERTRQLAAGSPIPRITPNVACFTNVECEQSYIRSSQGRKSLQYWEEKLTGVLPVLALPYDMPAQKTIRTTRIGKESMHFSQQEMQELKTLCRQMGINLSVLFMSVYTLLLHKLTGQEDFVIIMPTAGRTRKEFENSIGYYINMMITRNQVSEKMCFDELVKIVKHELLTGMENAAYPFPKLLADLDLDRSGSRETPFKVSFIYQNIFDELLDNQNLSGPFEVYDAVYQETAHVYSMEVEDLRKTLVLNIKYDLEVFNASTIRQHLSYCRQLLKGVSENSTRQLKAYSILSPEEIHHLLYERNATTVNYPQHKTLADLFEEQVTRTPDKVAVVHNGRRITYRQLDEMANRLANHIGNAGLPLHAPVCLVADKSLEQVWGVLGILKAGGHYIPVKGSLPENRLNELILQTASPMVLALPAYLDKITAHADVQVIPVTEEQFASDPASHEKKNIADTELAYIIFTSGSTGKPKGVMIDHRGAVNTLYDMNARFNITAEDKIFGISDLNFDLSVYDIFGIFACGATLVLPLEEERYDPQVWIRYVEEEQITVWNSVPQIVNLLVDRQEETGSNQITSIHTYFMSGDWIPLDLPDRIKQLNANANVFSLGGATEGSIWSIYYPVRKTDPSWKSIPYGYPLGNQEMYVLDSNLHPCPLNVPGDIYIGGVGVAKGYHNDPEKTAASFIYHPVMKKQLYRTGDLGAHHPEGYMVFLGRKDGQVKINGFRVELGEIETTLQNSDLVRQCVVTAVEDAHRNKRLVAYVVPAAAFDKQAIQAHLQAYLPDYMVPSLFIQIDKVPLSANGKVDHKTLPPVEMSSFAGREHVPPQDEMERQLALIWSQLLGVTAPGIHDDFFEAGGNSLIIIQLSHKINNNFNKELPLLEIMKHPTISGLKELLTAEEKQEIQKILTLREGPAEDVAFIVPGALGSTEGYLALAECLPVEGAVYGLQMKGVSGEAIPNNTIESMAAYNLDLIRQSGVNVNSGVTLVGHSYAGIVLYEMLRQAPDLQINNVIMLDCFVNPLSEQSELERLATYFRSLIRFSQPSLADNVVEALVRHMKELAEQKRMSFIFDTVDMLPPRKVAQMWTVFNASLSAVYQPAEKLDYQVDFIQANNTLLGGNDWGTNGSSFGWDKHFSQVKVISSDANHFTIVNTPHCHNWIATIKLEQTTPIL